MPIRFVITDKGKAWRIESDMPSLFGKSIGEKLNGNEIKPELDGYELEISGGSDDSGFPMAKDVEGLGLKRVLLTKGFGMRDNTRGLRLRKTLRGKTISEKTAQLNLRVLKHGHKKLEEIFPEQNKEKVKEVKKETSKAEEKKEETAVKTEHPASSEQKHPAQKSDKDITKVEAHTKPAEAPKAAAQ